MLRMRLRKWGLNRKNKKSVRTHSTLLAVSSSGGRSRASDVLSTLLERPVTTSPEDVIQRQFLKAIDDYLEHAWRLGSDLYEGQDVFLALNLGWEMEVAATSSSQYAWSALKKAANTLQEKDLDRISPLFLVRLLQSAPGQGEPRNPTELELHMSFCDYLSSAFGERHPVVMIVAFALQEKLDLSTCQGFLRISDAKSHAYSSTAEQRKVVTEWSRQCYIRILGYHGELQIMEDILNSWSPTSAHDEHKKILDLARIRESQGCFDEAEALLLDALCAFSKCEPNAFNLFDQVNCHTELLLRQARPQDAGEVFLDCLSLFEEGFRRAECFEDWNLEIDCFRMIALELEAGYEDFEIQQIIERLDAMALADHDVVEIDTET